MTRGQAATLALRWHEAVGAIADRVFLIWEDADERVASWTYGDFDRVVREVAGHLERRGVGPGRPVHLALANSPAFVAVWLASVQLGSAIVPSDPHASTRELADPISRARPAVGVCARERSSIYRPAAGGGPEVVEVDEGDTELAELRGPAKDPVLPDGDALASVMFTSGTTSAPKGVLVTQANYAFAGDVMAAAASLDPFDRQIVVLPLFHANAQYYSFSSAISAGSSVALMSGFSASGFLHQAARHRATHASLFAAPLRMILARGGDRPADLSLRHVWYAQNVSTDQYEQLSEVLGCRPRQLYGMTETMPAVLTNRAFDPTPQSMGLPTLGCSVELRQPDGDTQIVPGEVGEIVVGGIRGTTLFRGYLDDAQTTEQSFRRGWFRTGDLAWRDDRGRFFFAGRRHDVLKVAGENVSTVEVESVLADHSSILEAAVVGAPDPIRDEVPIAYVVLAPAAPSVDHNALASYCAERLAPAKRPRRFVFVDELPRTSVGKIRKFLLPREASGED